MRYHNITHDDMKNGDGIRVVLWVAGCEHHCPECQNPQTWDSESGIPFKIDDWYEIQEELSKDYVAGITFSGGDPLAPYNKYEVERLVQLIRLIFGDSKTIWIYTGYTFEQLIQANDPTLNSILSNIDILVDGEYKKELRNTNLKWRGSSNQRVIDVKKSLAENKVVLWCD